MNTRKRLGWLELIEGILLLILGIIVVIISAYLGITSLGNLATLFA